MSNSGGRFLISVSKRSSTGTDITRPRRASARSADVLISPAVFNDSMSSASMICVSAMIDAIFVILLLVFVRIFVKWSTSSLISVSVYTVAMIINPSRCSLFR